MFVFVFLIPQGSDVLRAGLGCEGLGTQVGQEIRKLRSQGGGRMTDLPFQVSEKKALVKSGSELNSSQK